MSTQTTRESTRIGFNVMVLLLSRVFVMALSLLQAGIIIRALGVLEFGDFGVAQAYTTLFTVTATLGIQRLMMRDVARSPELAWSYAWTATGVVAVLSAASTAAALGLTFVIPAYASIRTSVLLASVWVIVLFALQRPFEGILLAREKMAHVAILNVTIGILRFGFIYALVRVFPTSPGAHGALAIGSLLGFVFCIGLTIHVAGWNWPVFQWRLALEQVRECMPIFIAALFSMLYFKSDLPILQWFADHAYVEKTATGNYSATIRITEPILMVAGIWGTAVFPALCRLSAQSPTKYAALRGSSVRLGLLFAFPLAFGLAALAEPAIALLAGEEAGDFTQAVTLLRIICIAIPFFYFNGISQELLFAAHRNWTIVACYAVASVVSLAGNLTLIPVVGVNAVAFVAVAANASISIPFLIALAHDREQMLLSGLLIKSIVSCSVMYFAAVWVAHVSVIGAVIAGAVVYVGLQWILKTPTPGERDLLLSLLRAGARRIRRS